MKQLVYLISGGISKNTEEADPPLRIEQAYRYALESLDMDMDTAVPLIDGMIVSFLPPFPDHTARVMEQIGLSSTRHIRISDSEAAGGACFHEAVKRILSHEMDIVLACGWRSSAPLSSPLKSTAYVSDAGIARAALESQERYETVRNRMPNATPQQLAMVSVKNHRNALHNPYAQHRETISLGNGDTVPTAEITVDHVRNAPAVAWPLTQLDMCNTSNGAAVCILASDAGVRRIQKQARGRLRHPVIVSGVGYAHEDFSESANDRDDDLISYRTRAQSTLVRNAISQAYAQAGNIKHPFYELDFVELYDGDTPSEIRGYEDLGLCAKGEGGAFLDEGFPFLDTVDYGAKVRPFPRLRNVAVNPSGGLMACGYAGAATNLRQTVFSFWQIQGTIKHHFGSPALQVPNARRCAIYSQSETGDTVSVSILQR